MYNYINNDEWDQLIKHLPVHTGDFVYLPAGILHALKKGSIVYEIQQSTDVTFRFYDYHRKDKYGNERELHLTQAIDCLSYDQEMMKNNITPVEEKMDNGLKTTFISNDSFTVTKLAIEGKNTYETDNYQLATVVKGEGVVDGYTVKIGDNFLIPQHSKIEIDGNMIIMMTTK